MQLKVDRADQDPAPPVSGFPAIGREMLIAWGAPGRLRVLLSIAAIAGAFVFILGVGNRFTRGPLFVYIPEVSLLPPIGKSAWQAAFTIHQQSPLWALCGGYQVSGMESIAVYQWLYMWEWTRIAALTVLVATLLLAMGGYAGRMLAGKAETRAGAVFSAKLAAVVLVYLGLRWLADNAALYATYNIGQYRHALDVVAASLALGLLAAAALVPRRVAWTKFSKSRSLWLAGILTIIGTGALMEATDAAPLWREFPGYADGWLPGSDRLLALKPPWRNVTENAYLMQALHRLASLALLLAAAGWLARAVSERQNWKRPGFLFGLLMAEATLGVLTLSTNMDLFVSGFHQVAAVMLVTVVILPPVAGEEDGAMSVEPRSAAA